MKKTLGTAGIQISPLVFGTLPLVVGKPVIDETAGVSCGCCGAECPEVIIRVV
ncbi:MAG: hypothetical protein H6Q56_1200 [Deltaproteobacteria bacterium]|nr:hypothetical protein [Deltaproteobacteria bacterium]